MFANILTVGQQALVLFLLIAVGFVCGKTNLIGEASVGDANRFVVYVVIPCSLISAFQLELTPENVHAFLTACVCALAIHLFNFGMGFLCIRERDNDRKRVFTTTCTYTNCNFISFPLQTALLGSSGIFYGSAFAMLSPILFFTVGIAYLQGSCQALQLKKILLNPGILGIAIGLTMFFGKISLPPLLLNSVNYLAVMAVGLPMVLIGTQLARTDLRQILRDKTAWLATLLRLLILPGLELGAMILCGVRGPVLIATVISAAAPSAALVAMMSEVCGKDGRLAAQLVSLQTVLSVVTMPLIVGMAQMLA